jgi:hypothetical protein
MRPPLPSVLLSRRAKIALATVAVIVVVLIVLVQLSGIYINYLWYHSVGHRNVYSTMLWTKVSLFFIFGVLMALIIGGNLVIAYVLRPPFRPMSPEQQNLQNYTLLLEPRRKLILAVVSLIALLSAGASAQGNWAVWQLWLHGGSFGQTDPQFGRDISFYAWDYPVYRSLLGFGFTAVILSLVLAVVVHYLTGAIRLQTPGPKVTVSARRHLTILVFVFMALKAVAYWLDRYGFVFSNRSKFTGASYTDVHAALPAKTILFWIAIILAIGVLASMWLRSALLPGIYPAILQSVSVNPNASDKERPYISRNITATRQAYGIVNAADGGPVKYVNYAATSSPNPAALTDSNTTVGNIRILDPNIISPTFTQQQKIATPYGFSPRLNVDRYDVAGDTHDYIVGVRNLVPSNLSGALNNWINQYTVYTHGYGFVAAQADTDVTNAAGAYTEYDIPAKGPLGLTHPDVYFGPGMNAYSIVGAKGRKREYNGTNSTPSVTYSEGGGVSLSNWLTRAAFAFKYKETNFLLNNVVSSPGARIILNRDPAQLVHKVAPFLTIDGAPYPIVDKSSGDIVWMVDGYTTMANYPYSERQSLSALTGTSLQRDQANTQINYIRNSVKATVDAYTGKVTLYAWDQQNHPDPILQAWERIFPGLITTNPHAMPSSIRDHVRYPQDLFNVQRALLAQYHINNAVASYNGRGKWQVPTDPFAAGNQPPYYILGNAPGSNSDKPEFQLTTPMEFNNAKNLAAYISVDCDPGHYGQFTVLEVPTNRNVAGPTQVAGEFKSNGTVTKDLSLFNAAGGQSTIEHGNLLTLPVGNSFLYVEPLYVESVYPTLQRVIAYYGGNIGYTQDLADTLNDLRNGNPVATSLNVAATPGVANPSSPPNNPSSTSPSSQSSGSSTAPPPGSGTSVSGSQVQLLQQIDGYFKLSQQKYAHGNYAGGAAAQSKAQALIEQYLTRFGALPSTSGSSGRSSPSSSSPAGKSTASPGG